MGSRLKEEEKNERIIRNLLKLADNRRCINCNSLGAQYVCTNFWTFICTNCSGIHREFTHRVKSISMAKFTSQEVSSLQGGGNAKAKETYLKEWDAQKIPYLMPGCNVERVRDFIKHVYVDRRYTGERNLDKPPRGTMGATEDINESRRSDTHQGGSPSPQYEDRFERRYSDRTSQGGRSPGYDQGKWQQGDTKRSPARSEIVNDWRREDRFGVEKKYDEGRISDGSSMSGGRSPVHQVEPTLSSPPVVRPIRDILGDNAIPLRVIQPPKEDSSRSLDGSTRTQRTASSSSLASSNGNSNELRKETSLIDFDAVAEMPATAPTPPVQNHITSMSQEATTLAADNWADFGAVSDVKASQAPSTASPFDSILLELAVPASAAAVGVSGTGTPSIEDSFYNASVFSSTSSSGSSLNPSFINAPVAPMVTNSIGMTHGVNPLSANPASMSVLPANSGFLNATNSGQWMQQTHHHSASTGIGGLNPPQSFTPIFGVQPNHQQWDAQGPAHVSVAKSTFQPASTPDLKTTSESVGRIELPEDLFASPIPTWQTGTPYGVGFNMQYNPMQAHQMHMSTFQQPSNSSNPFDVGGEQPNVQFPAMSSLQHALPNMGPSHPAVPGSYMEQQVPAVMPSRPPGPAGLGLEGSAFGGVNPTQHLGGLYSAPTNQHTFSSVGGNPFG